MSHKLRSELTAQLNRIIDSSASAPRRLRSCLDIRTLALKDKLRLGVTLSSDASEGIKADFEKVMSEFKAFVEKKKEYGAQIDSSASKDSFSHVFLVPRVAEELDDEKKEKPAKERRPYVPPSDFKTLVEKIEELHSPTFPLAVIAHHPVEDSPEVYDHEYLIGHHPDAGTQKITVFHEK